MHRLLADLGSPERVLPPVIHVAGTNGKGSAIAVMRTLLEAGGLRVHTYTSPHLVHFNERIRLASINASRPVADDVLENALMYCLECNRGRPITQFEVVTAAAFHMFATHDADVVLLEAGLGGRCDATNVVPKPVATVITSISYDHETYLGSSIEQIAVEKAGIFRPGIPVIVGPQQYFVAENVISRAASLIGAPIHKAGRDFRGKVRGDKFVYIDSEGLHSWPLPGLAGEHQIDNSSTAIATLLTTGLMPDSATVRRALPLVRWPGRLQPLTGRVAEMLPPDTDVVVDGGHNPGAAAVIASELRRRNETDQRSTVLILGMLATKDAAAFLAPFLGSVFRVVTVPLRPDLISHDPQTLAAIAGDIGLSGHAASSVTEAIAEAGRLTSTLKLRLLFIGSLHLAGEVLELDASLLDPAAERDA
nr:folylpolyglutamate synthase/dihydrofolate synthase family protein [Methylorubrum extorquens]